MALSSDVLAALIQANLEADGAKGSNLQGMCAALAKGITNAIVGKSFTTTDVGTITGAGTGVGLGITGLVSSTMVDAALSQMTSQGSKAKDFMTAVMNAVISHLATSAELATVDAPVFLGVGTITVGSITVTAAEMGSNIDSALADDGAKGSNRTNLSNAIAFGICGGIATSGTGTVTITGSGTPTGPGTGTGTGTIS